MVINSLNVFGRVLLLSAKVKIELLEIQECPFNLDLSYVIENYAKSRGGVIIKRENQFKGLPQNKINAIRERRTANSGFMWPKYNAPSLLFILFSIVCFAVIFTILCLRSHTCSSASVILLLILSSVLLISVL